MKISNYYLPLTKELPAEASTISHKYSIKAGLIKKNAAGIYTWLPLGTKLISNIQSIVREEMNKAGNLEVIMPCIQSAEVWKKSGRYESYGREMLRIKDRHNKEMLFSPTNEEIITEITRNHIKSYKDLPKCLYQIQWKFRDEIRPRFGVMRGREFLMKDAYSFDLNKKNAIITYRNMYDTYVKIFKKIGLKPVAVKADTGPIGGDLSHEFHIFAETGESMIYYDKKLEEMEDNFNELKEVYTAADDLHDQKNCPVPESNLKASKAIEVGHIFYFGTKYSEVMNAQVSNRDGKLNYIHMGSYGIGISRLIGAIIEANHDEKGIIWPESISPFKIGLINLHKESREIAEKIYKNLDNALFDDTEDSSGVKFSRMDLIGLPQQIIISKKSLENNTVEIKHRKTGTLKTVSVNKLFKV
ncbi:MAG: proline--tRNA ligase [Rickettsiaceae bacterium H1]|nr:proline--tRNA ligase [Rickettsiaceae bacterium H1]